MGLAHIQAQRIKAQIKGLRQRWRLGTQLATLTTPPLLVYQMGKVGSASVYHSLRRQGVAGIFHVHRLHPDHIATLAQAEGRPWFDHEYLGQGLYQQVIRRGHPVKVLTMVREPIGRNLSAFFQNLEAFLDRPLASYSPDELQAVFLARYPHQTVLDWFDIDFAPALGLNIYDIAFPQDRGWLTIQQGPLECLVLQCELPDATKAQVIGAFLGLSDFHLERWNQGADKSYAAAYRRFKEHLGLPPTYVDTMVSAPYSCHFYSAVIRQQWRQRWCPDGQGCADGERPLA